VSSPEVLAELQAIRHDVAGLQGLALRHPKYNEHEYFLAVEKAFTQWEEMQNVRHKALTRLKPHVRRGKYLNNSVGE